MNLKGQSLFYVEFGEPNIGGGYFSSSRMMVKPVFVIAKNYDEASEKALDFANTQIETQGVVDYDGSLNMNQLEKIKVNSVKLASDNIVY